MIADNKLPLPDWLREKHPELVEINEALLAYWAGRPVSTHCPTCGELLTIETIPAAGAVWATCPNGCTSYRERWDVGALPYGR